MQEWKHPAESSSLKAIFFAFATQMRFISSIWIKLEFIFMTTIFKRRRNIFSVHGMKNRYVLHSPCWRASLRVLIPWPVLTWSILWAMQFFFCVRMGNTWKLRMACVCTRYCCFWKRTLCFVLLFGTIYSRGSDKFCNKHHAWQQEHNADKATLW